MVKNNVYSLKSIKNKIKKMMDSCNVNVLLGAGFSSMAFPSMEQLREIFLFLLNNLNSEISKLSVNKTIKRFLSNDKYSEDLIVKELIQDFKKHLTNSDDIAQKISLFEKENFEDVLYQSNIENFITMKTEHSNLSKCFTKLFHRIHFIVKEKKEYVENIDRIASLITWLIERQDYHTKKSMKETINIFTTNYDTLIEESLEKMNLYYYNGFNGIIKRKFYPDNYNYSYVDDMNLNKNFFQVKKSFFNLMKLHGSITWSLIGNNSNYELNEIGIKDETILDDTTTYPHIIYPSTDKFHMSLNYDHYYKLQTAFKDSLYKKDRCLLVFGFSMKDNHLWKIIDSALSTGNLSVFLFTSECILSSSENDEKNKYLDDEKIENSFRKELLNKPGVNFVCCQGYEFSEFFKEETTNDAKKAFTISPFDEEEIEKLND